MKRTAPPAPPETGERLKAREVAGKYPVLSLRVVYELMAAGEIDRIAVGRPGSKRPALHTTAASVEAYLARVTTHARAAS